MGRRSTGMAGRSRGLRPAIAALVVVLVAALTVQIAAAAQLPLSTSQVFTQDFVVSIPVPPDLASDQFPTQGSLQGQTVVPGGTWQVHEAQFQIRDGDLYRVGRPNGESLAGLPVGNAAVQVSSQVTPTGVFAMGVTARMDSTGTTYLRATWLGVFGSDLRIDLVDGNTVTTLATLADLGGARTATLSLTVDGTAVTASLDGDSVSATLTPAQDALLTGTDAGIWSGGADSRDDVFHDFNVQAVP